MIIRAEESKDTKAISNVIQAAFKDAPHSDGSEHLLVARLRDEKTYRNDFSIVAEENDEIIGHVFLSEIEVGNQKAVALAPLSVLPAFQKQGIGKSLLQAAHERAKQAGYPLVVILGDSAYYGRFGYQKASQFGIYPPTPDFPEDYFLVKVLAEIAELPSGKVTYPQAFGI